MKAIQNLVMFMIVASGLLATVGLCAEENTIKKSVQKEVFSTNQLQRSDGVTTNSVSSTVIIPSKSDSKVVDVSVEQKGRPWYRDRLEIGLRVSFNEMDTKDKWDEGEQEGFLGTIAHFENKNKMQFSNIVLSYRVLDWLSVGATWDMIDEVAVTRTEDLHCDGEWKDSGPSLSLVFNYPKKLFGFLTPYAEIGTHFSNGTFEAYPWWHLGYASPSVYRELGSPSKGRGSYRRYICSEESETLTLLWGAGLKVHITDRFLLDFAYRHIDCDQTAHFYLERGGVLLKDNGLYDIPLSYAQFCAGIRYVF